LLKSQQPEARSTKHEIRNKSKTQIFKTKLKQAIDYNTVSCLDLEHSCVAFVSCFELQISDFAACCRSATGCKAPHSTEACGFAFAATRDEVLGAVPWYSLLIETLSSGPYFVGTQDAESKGSAPSGNTPYKAMALI
jgi:hypothetical protein